MQQRSIVHVLRDYTPGAERARGLVGSIAEAEDEPDRAAAAAAQAYERGRCEGRAEMERVVADLRAWQVDEMSGRLEQERARWVSDEADRLVAALETGMRHVNAEIVEAVAAALRPFIAERLRARAVDELMRGIDCALEANRHAAITCSGNPDLVAAVAARLSERGIPVETVEKRATDVNVSVDAIRLRTRLDQWVKWLEGQADGS